MFGLFMGLAVLTCLYALAAVVKPFWIINTRKQALGAVLASLVSLPIIGIAGALSSAMTPPPTVPTSTPAPALPARPASIAEAAWQERISICNLAGFSPATCAPNDVVFGEARKSVEAAEAKAKEEAREKAREGARRAAENEEAERDTKDMMWIEITKDAVRNSLRDPSSAKFQNVKVYRPLPGQDTPIVCGEVNSKNAFGGMTGFQGFIASGDALPPVLEEGFSEGEYAKSRRQLCINVN